MRGAQKLIRSEVQLGKLRQGSEERRKAGDAVVGGVEHPQRWQMAYA
eukprot:CAMPEP_0174727486 /NCGR_PEP_ID=MMETSP1094-20130205/49885_1 /TAXON_ID=156173 /ORGANISM="Chrysochromulina brevifilum, Strain UTEX LB 985" /LENGTH=46 /DNA_ID= /DNA_START= /DNA_END= /DNA_ORIENTATION=